MAITTSKPSNRSVKKETATVGVAAPRGNTSRTDWWLTPEPPSSSTANDKTPIVSGKGSKARITGYSLPPGAIGPKRTDLRFINGKIKLKDPKTGQLTEYNGYYVPVSKSSGGGGSKPSEKVPPLPPGKPSEYEWNLPPHKWSLPTTPEQVNDLQPGRSAVTDKYRRGRLWWKANADIEIFDGKNNKSSIGSGDSTRKYGFQFLWNPEAFRTQVSVQLEATPHRNDRFIGVAGAFPATETITFNIRLDRTNDFACASARFGRPSRVVRVKPKKGAESVISAGEVSDLAKLFYSYEGVFNIGDAESKLVELFERGTLADIEYLYKAINGPGPGVNQSWVNGRGIETADIGFLMPTLLHVDIGPLSYDGYVTGLDVNHIMFTREMIPIRSDVTISLNLLATVGITSEDAEKES